MDERQAKEFGALLRKRREKLGLSTHELARQADISQPTILRLEQGRFAAPRPDKLARIADVLGLGLADLYARVGYVTPSDLPSFEAYLTVKYPALPKRAKGELTRHFAGLAAAHGMPADDPRPRDQGDMR